MSISYTVDDGVGVFTIDNGRLNLFTMEMHRSFYYDYLKFIKDDSVKVAVLTGNGENFSAGDDLTEVGTPKRPKEGPPWDELLITHPRTKPMISVIDGYCLGQGCVYALTVTDIRIAGKSVQIGFPEIAYGMGGISGATRLAANIPSVHAAYLALTGEKIDGQQAKEYQLVNEVHEDPLARAMQIAAQIARHPLIAIQTELDGLHRGAEITRADAFNHARAQYNLQRKIHLSEGHTAMGDLKKHKG